MPPYTPAGPRAALAVVAAVALSTAACGDAASGTLHTAAGYTLEAADVPVSICPEGDDARLADEEGTLIGAHFALRVDCVASFTEVPDDLEAEHLFGEDVTTFAPPEGYEFTVVQFAPDPGAEAEHEPDRGTELHAVLTIGESEWTFDGEAPAPGSTYLAVAAEDAPASLRITDDERTQSIDLRERTRSGLVEGLYNGSSTQVTTESVTHSVSAYLATGGYEYTVEDWTYDTNFVATRTVYEPDEGWIAEPDRAVLSVEFLWFHSGSGLEWSIDPAQALTVSGPDGELDAVDVEATPQDLGDGDRAQLYRLEYDVPAEALEFDLVFAPRGELTWAEQGVDLPISDEGTHELSVDFS